MPLYLTGAHSSRISKPGQDSRASLLAKGKRVKAGSQRRFAVKTFIEHSDDGQDVGDQASEHAEKIVTAIKIASATDVSSAMKHTTTSMFCNLPERAGMNSVRIAEVLGFQKSLPSLVSLAHVHALILASSKTEREIQAMSAAGLVRRLKISGRGNDISGLSEMLIMVSDYQDMLIHSRLPAETVSVFINVLKQNPRASTVSSRLLPHVHSTALTKAGFLVGASLSGTRNISLSGSSLVSLPTISRSASGSSAAVGGEAAFEQLGGVGTARRSNSETYLEGKETDLALSVPNMGAYLRLVAAGRSHLLELLRASKHKQAPMYLLKERWDGAVDSDSQVSTAKKLRGEFSTVLPAKTKKWKNLNGLNFDWVIEECLGAGLIELFETHSVGYGVRALA